MCIHIYTYIFTRKWRRFSRRAQRLLLFRIEMLGSLRSRKYGFCYTRRLNCREDNAAILKFLSASRCCRLYTRSVGQQQRLLEKRSFFFSPRYFTVGVSDEVMKNCGFLDRRVSGLTNRPLLNRRNIAGYRRCSDYPPRDVCPARVVFFTIKINFFGQRNMTRINLPA